MDISINPGSSFLLLFQEPPPCRRLSLQCFLAPETSLVSFWTSNKWTLALTLMCQASQAQCGVLCFTPAVPQVKKAFLFIPEQGSILCIDHHFCIYSLSGHWVCSQFKTFFFFFNDAMNNRVHNLCVYVRLCIHLAPGKYIEMEFLICTVGTCLAL